MKKKNDDTENLFKDKFKAVVKLYLQIKKSDTFVCNKSQCMFVACNRRRFFQNFDFLTFAHEPSFLQFLPPKALLICGGILRLLVFFLECEQDQGSFKTLNRTTFYTYLIALLCLSTFVFIHNRLSTSQF